MTRRAHPTPQARAKPRRSGRASAAKKARVKAATPLPDDPKRPPADPRFFDVDLPGWAGEERYKLGRKDALLGRVERLQLADEGRSVVARVRGERPTPHQIQVWIDERGLTSRCDCSAPHGAPCRHAVAAVEALRFPLQHVADGKARQPPRSRRGQGKIVRPAQADAFVVLGEQERNLTRPERLAAARAEETKARQQQARRARWRVEQINDDTEPPRFKVADKDEGPRTVVLRGDKAALARCDCRDFEANELGTCRHIERVRVWYLRKPKKMPPRLLSVWWCPKAWTERRLDLAREFRLTVHGVDGPLGLETWFDDRGWIRPAPAGWNRAAWIVAAVDAAERCAERQGLRFDLDSLVWPHVRGVQREEVPAPAGRTLEQIQDELDGQLGMQLHPYQRQGTRFIAGRGSAFLADDMGLGKTVQAIAAAEALARAGLVRRTLVVCPASLKHQWKREIDKALGREAWVVEGRAGLRAGEYQGWREGFLITNYELVLRDVDLLRGVAPDLVILDEAQRIKNWGTKTAQAVMQLDSPYKFILTGTPLENRLLELHSLVEFVRPRALGPRWRLLPYHAVTADGGRVVAYEGLKLLRHRLQPFFIRRERSQVLDQLPDRTDNTFWTGMTHLQKRRYRRYATQLAKLVGGQQPLRTHEVRLLLQLLTQMRIVCNAAAQHDWNDIEPRLRDPSPPSDGEIKALASPKLEEFARVLEDLLDNSHTKVVVFSQWERALRLARFVVRDVLASRQLTSGVFYGGLSSAARAELIDRFHDDAAFRVLFSTDAGGLGLNLQEAASIVVNLEVPWNPAILQQRIGRVHRMGQKRSVQVLHFVTRGGIEERVRQVVENKQSLFSGLLSEDSDVVEFSSDENRSQLVERIRTLVDEEDV